MADADTPVTLRTRKFIRNPLLGRKQMVVDILHPTRPNISKDELRDKLAGLYKATKDQVSVFGLRTQFGGGKTTGFALIYDSPEALQKFEPRYRLVRIGKATKVEKASRQQRAYCPPALPLHPPDLLTISFPLHRQAAQEQAEDPPRHGQGQGREGEEGQINAKYHGAWEGFLGFRSLFTISCWFLSPILDRTSPSSWCSGGTGHTSMGTVVLLALLLLAWARPARPFLFAGGVKRRDEPTKNNMHVFLPLTTIYRKIGHGGVKGWASNFIFFFDMMVGSVHLVICGCGLSCSSEHRLFPVFKCTTWVTALTWRLRQRKQ
ncbi:hypothetical protein RB598_008889 [Gaeumannomyces tritici]